MRLLSQTELAGKVVLMRLDLNVKIKQNGSGKDALLDDTRVVASLPSIKHCLGEGSKLILMTHLGRPDKDRPAAEQPEFSAQPLAAILGDYLGKPVSFAATLEDVAPALQQNPIVLLQNTRFWPGETANDPALSEQLAGLCDLFVLDAFGSAHRAHASTAGVCSYVSQACAGLLLEKELTALGKVMAEPARPLLAIIGGAKVGDKLKLLEKLATHADMLIVGGGIANTFLAATGNNVGKSLYEPELQDLASKVMQQTKVILPQDLILASSLDDAQGQPSSLDEFTDSERMILDVGEASCAEYAKAIASARTIIWNGPLGVFENEPFAQGTRALVAAISDTDAYTLAGGGETIAALNLFKGKADYVSTGGGAFLEYLEKGTLPAIEALEQNAQQAK